MKRNISAFTIDIHLKSIEGHFSKTVAGHQPDASGRVTFSNSGTGLIHSPEHPREPWRPSPAGNQSNVVERRRGPNAVNCGPYLCRRRNETAVKRNSGRPAASAISTRIFTSAPGLGRLPINNFSYSAYPPVKLTRRP